MSVRQLPTKLQQIAESELNEVPSQVQEDLLHLRRWLQQQLHIKARTDDQWLLNFLRGCKFRLQLTKEKLNMYYSIRNALPEFYLNRDPLQNEIQEVLKLGIALPLTNTEDLFESEYFLTKDVQ